MFSIQIINAKTLTFRIWNFHEIQDSPDHDGVTIWSIFHGLHYVFLELNN
jgi:hypothetical protein